MEGLLDKAQASERAAESSEAPANEANSPSASDTLKPTAPVSETPRGSSRQEEALEQRVREVEAREQAVKNQEAKAMQTAAQESKENQSLKSKVTCCQKENERKVYAIWHHGRNPLATTQSRLQLYFDNTRLHVGPVEGDWPRSDNQLCFLLAFCNPERKQLWTMSLPPAQ